MAAAATPAGVRGAARCAACRRRQSESCDVRAARADGPARRRRGGDTAWPGGRTAVDLSPDSTVAAADDPTGLRSAGDRNQLYSPVGVHGFIPGTDAAQQ